MQNRFGSVEKPNSIMDKSFLKKKNNILWNAIFPHFHLKPKFLHFSPDMNIGGWFREKYPISPLYNPQLLCLLAKLTGSNFQSHGLQLVFI